jgi:hypothetical protein
MKQQTQRMMSPAHGGPRDSAGRESDGGPRHWVKVLLCACALGAALLFITESLGAAQLAGGAAIAGELQAR